jgi:chromate transporter
MMVDAQLLWLQHLWLGHQGLGWPALLELFAHGAMLSLLAIGGALAVAPELQRFVVDERAWMSAVDFSSGIALAQAAPGPNLIFVAVIGFQAAGVAGAMATMLGVLLPSSVLALSVARLQRGIGSHRLSKALTQGMAPVTVGLLLTTTWVLAAPAAESPWSWVLVAIAVLVMMRTRWSPLWVLALGAITGALGWV